MLHVNEFAETHPEEIADDVRAVLPVTGVDVMAHAHSVVHGLFVADRGYAAARPRPPRHLTSRTFDVSNLHGVPEVAWRLR